MGKVFVTNTDHPKSVCVYAGCFAFYAGEPDKEIVKNKPEGFVIMVPRNEEWAELIEECYPDAKKVIRYAIKKDTIFDREKLQGFVNELSAGYEIHEIDADIYDKCLGNPVTEDFDVQYFVVPHDATQYIGFAIRCEGELFVLMTDLGHTTPEAMQWASLANTVVVESNYDEEMLFGGDYPEELKRRISHGIGHLSNKACAEAIGSFLHPGLRNIFLCHLSGNNNTPELAYKSACEALQAAGVEPGTINIRVLRRGVSSPLLNL
jgi:hypothetical protein